MSSEDVQLIAGMTLEHEVITAGVSTWAAMPSMTSYGGVGEQAEKKEKTNLSNKSKCYGAGMQDAPDKNLKGYVIPPQEAGSQYFADYMAQQVFIKRCRNKEEFNIRINWPNDGPNSYLFKSLGYEIDDSTQEDWKMFTVNGSQNTRTLWVCDIEGGSTVAANATLSLSLNTTPLDLDRGSDVITWMSSDESKATVDEHGTVNGIAAGETTISGLFRGVTGSVVVTVTA